MADKGVVMLVGAGDAMANIPADVRTPSAV